MKIKLSFLPEEEGEAVADLAALLRLHPGAKPRRSDRHPPFKHIYLTTSPPPRAQKTLAPRPGK